MAYAKDEAIKIEKPVIKEAHEMKYRYACEGCTGIAFRSTNTMVGVKVSCQQCGKEQETKPENYIVL